MYSAQPSRFSEPGPAKNNMELSDIGERVYAAESLLNRRNRKVRLVQNNNIHFKFSCVVYSHNVCAIVIVLCLTRCLFLFFAHSHREISNT